MAILGKMADMFTGPQSGAIHLKRLDPAFLSKWIITVQSKDKLRFDSYDQDPSGKYFKNAEVVATRVGKSK